VRPQVAKVQQAPAAEPNRAESSRDAGETSTAAMSQLEHLSALVDRAARKSGPPPAGASAAPPTCAPEDSSEEEALETYLDRFMERLTGKRADVPRQWTRRFQVCRRF
jgi:hypothetical protein